MACKSFVPLRKHKKSNDHVWINKKIKTMAKEKRRVWFKNKYVANKIFLSEPAKAVQGSE